MKMSDIAKMSDVSIATVSRVINNPSRVRSETRKKVEKVLSETKFIANAVARGLAVKSMKAIGVLTVDVRNLYFSHVTYTIERKFTELGYYVMLSNTGGELGEKEKYLRVMLENQIDGLILVGSVFKEQSGNKHILAASEKVPVVMVNSLLDGDNIYSILCDDTRGVRDAVSYLVKNGRRDIYYFNDVKSFSGLAKLQGFKEEMAAYGLDYGNVIEISRSLEGGWDGVRKLRAEKRQFNAIVTGEDITAVGALKGLYEYGCRVPDDVSIIGYNNSILAEVSTPRLTSVDNVVEAMAKNAVQILYDVLQGEQVSHKVTLTPTLFIRDSA